MKLLDYLKMNSRIVVFLHKVQQIVFYSTEFYAMIFTNPKFEPNKIK